MALGGQESFSPEKQDDITLDGILCKLKIIATGTVRRRVLE